MSALDEVPMLDDKSRDRREDSVSDQDDDESSDSCGNVGAEAADACKILQLYEGIARFEGE